MKKSPKKETQKAPESIRVSMIIYRKLSDLKKLPNNPRVIKDDDFKRLCKSISDLPEYFEKRPLILSNRTGGLVVICGNQRYEAARHIKLKEVPTSLIENLTEEKEREIIIKDNVLNGSWEYEELANRWNASELIDWGVNLLMDEESKEEKGKENSLEDKIVVKCIKSQRDEFVSWLSDKLIDCPFDVILARK